MQSHQPKNFHPNLVSGLAKFSVSRIHRKPLISQIFAALIFLHVSLIILIKYKAKIAKLDFSPFVYISTCNTQFHVFPHASFMLILQYFQFFYYPYTSIGYLHVNPQLLLNVGLTMYLFCVFEFCNGTSPRELLVFGSQILMDKLGFPISESNIVI